jgi:hypothetical protein
MKYASVTRASALGVPAEFVVFLAGLIALGLILMMPDFLVSGTYLDMLRYAASVLKGRLLMTDISADIWGFQGILRHEDAYPLESEAAARAGFDWPAHHANTHPPTAFLLVAPVSFLPLGAAVATWSWAMLALIAASFRIMGLTWFGAIGFGCLSLLWPPAAFSLAQFTPIWMFAIVVTAYAGQNLAGTAIAVAAMTKYYPAILLWPFIVRRNFRPLIIFVAIFVVAAAVLYLLDAGIFARYFEANRTASPYNIARVDNASPLAYFYRKVGVPGALAVLVYLVWIWLVTLPRQKDHVFSAMLHGYLSVALLPIGWLYSTLPLLPVMLLFMRNVSVAGGIAAFSFIALLLCPRFGDGSAKYIVGAILLLGVCFVADVLAKERGRWGDGAADYRGGDQPGIHNQ